MYENSANLEEVLIKLFLQLFAIIIAIMQTIKQLFALNC